MEANRKHGPAANRGVMSSDAPHIAIRESSLRCPFGGVPGVHHVEKRWEQLFRLWEIWGKGSQIAGGRQDKIFDYNGHKKQRAALQPLVFL